MAIYGKAVWRPLTPENMTQPFMPHPTQIILHTAVDSKAASSLWPFFERGTNLESHFFCQWAGAEQYVDTDRTADANYKANPRAISVETEDDGDPTIPWNDFQLQWIIDFCLWGNEVHGIPLTAVTKWDGPGIGYHSQYPGVWTPYKGKTCPGPVRIAQLKEIILPALIIGVHHPVVEPAPSAPQEDDEVDARFVQIEGRGEVYVATTGGRATHAPSEAAMHDAETIVRADGGTILEPPPVAKVVTTGGYPVWVMSADAFAARYGTPV